MIRSKSSEMFCSFPAFTRSLFKENRPFPKQTLCFLAVWDMVFEKMEPFFVKEANSYIFCFLYIFPVVW